MLNRLHNIFILLLFATQTLFAATISEDIAGLVATFQPYVPLAAMGMIILAAVIYALGQLGGVEIRARATVWSTNILIGVFFAAIIVTLVFGILEAILPRPTPADPVFYRAVYQAVILSLLFSAVITALFYLLSYVLQSPVITAMAKEELAALLVSGLIVFFFITFNSTLSATVYGILTYGNPELQRLIASQSAAGAATGQFFAKTHVDIAQGSLNILFVKMRTSYTHLYLFEVLIGFLSTVSFPIGSPFSAVNIISFSFMPFDGLSLLSNAHTIIVEAIGYVMAVLWAKEFLLIFTRESVPFILLPLGIVLRSVPFFRTTGSSLIAISITAFFVYPLSIVLSNFLIFDLYGPYARDFIFMPETASFFDAGKIPTQDELQKITEEKQKKILDEFKDPNAAAEKIKQKCGGAVDCLLISVSSVIKQAYTAISGFVKTVIDVGRFMWRFSGDWMSTVISGNALLPTSAAGGLYAFIIDEVVTTAPMVVLVLITSLLEIIFTITMYRNIALLIGGEAEIIGLGKLV